MNKNRSSYHWISFAAAGVLAAVVAGCGGGGDGSGSFTPTTTAAVAVPASALNPGAPATNAVVGAAAASPATTNTADNPAQAFGVILAAGGNPITIQSPPVVNFAVIDSTGKHVPGLTLFNSAGATADPNCSGNNVTFAIAKWDGTYWQNLLSRQRLAADTATQFAVVEGTTDPKPTASKTNPATAVTDPTTRIVGILEENAAGGYYTYRFAMDVTTALLMKDAVAGQNVASTSTLANKIANNGNLAVKDGKTIHRLGAQLCYTDPATKAKVVVNPILDFTVGADGKAVPVNANTSALSRQVVTKDSCNDCHQKLAMHGGQRVDPNYCVICHNPGSTDYNTNNPIDLRVMVHRIHFGPGLTKDYTVADYTAKATDAAGNVTGTKYPQDIRNCTKCHTATATAAHPTSQGNNWMNNPTRAACGSCHDGVNFATGKATTLNGVYSIHVGGIRTDDTQCALCHTAADIPVYHPAVTPPSSAAILFTGGTSANSNSAWLAGNQNNLPAGAIKISYDISSVSVSSAGKPSIVFRILQNGARADFNTFSATKTEIYDNFMGAPSVFFVFAVPQDGISAPADFNASASASIRQLWNGSASGTSAGTLTGPDASGYYTATLTGVTIPTSGANKAVMVTGGVGYTYSLPGATTAATGGTMPLTQTNLPDYPTTVSPVNASFKTGGLVVIAQDQNKVATGYTGRRAAVADAKCDKCHEQLGVFTEDAFHGGQRNDAPTCSWCHNPNRTSSGWSASSGYYIHAIHGGQKRTDKFTWHASANNDGVTPDGFWEIELPHHLVKNGVLKNCETCHVAGMNDYSNSATTSAYPNMLWPTVATGRFAAAGATLTTYAVNAAKTACTGTVPATPTTALSAFAISPYVTQSAADATTTHYGIGFSFNASASTTYGCKTDGTLYSVAAGASVAADPTTLVMSPFAAVCVACHDGKTTAGTDVKSHMRQNGATIYAARSSVYKSATDATLVNSESCLLCHSSTGVAPIKEMHAK